jgi:nucleoside-diphosphate-sugar epimerase
MFPMRFPADIFERLRTHYEGRAVCVTGGAGFIGGHLCDALLSLGASITVLDDLSNANLDHLTGLIELEPDRVRFVHGSVLDDDAVADAIEESRTVFHLAAIGSVPRSIAEPQRTWSVNATGTVRVLEAARRAWDAPGPRLVSGGSAPERVVFAASSSAYGDDPSLPKREDYPPRPLSPYAASKLAGEHALSAWSSAYGLSTVSLRYFNIFGPRQSADSAYAAVIAAFARRLLEGKRPIIFGDGRQSRDFTSVTNAVLATLLAGAAPTRLAGDVINVGAGRSTTLLELARIMADRCSIAHLEPEFRPGRAGDVPHSLADLSRAQELLGYRPVATLEDGLEETLAWHRRGMAAARPASP